MIAPLRSITTVPWGANLASRREKPVGERRIFFYLDVNDRNILIKKEKTVYKKQLGLGVVRQKAVQAMQRGQQLLRKPTKKQ